MYRIGLTGNIATGKSLVLRRLADLGAYCLDADQLVHEAMQPDTAAWQAIRIRFGASVLLPGGVVDRAALGRVVFADATALADLERIIHPWVVAEVETRLTVSGASVAVVEAIKLLEASLGSRCHAVWVTTCTRERQLERLVRNRNLSESEARLRVDAQPAAGTKVARADVLLENDASTEDLRALVDGEWTSIAAGRAPGRDTEPSLPCCGRDTWRVDEADTWAIARLLRAGSYRIFVSPPARMPRLSRVLLPALEKGGVAPALLIPARTGYRQCMSAMGYEEVLPGGGDEGETEYRRVG